MSPDEATRRARGAVIDAVGAAAPREVPYLLALVEASGGLCPRNGRVLIGALVRAGALSRTAAGWVGRGERFASFTKESPTRFVAGSVRRTA